MQNKSFLNDVLNQPFHLRLALNNFPFEDTESLFRRMKTGEFNKIILTGHGSSYNSLYPAFLQLSAQSVPVALWQTAELLHYGSKQIDAGTLICINSQSGKSAEAKSLMEEMEHRRPACLLSLTNDITSPLANNSDIVLNLNAGEDFGIAVKTYFNALSMAKILALQLCGEDGSKAIEDMLLACSLLDEYLKNWQDHLREIEKLIGEYPNAMVVGRGPSMATALNGALNQKEAAWMLTEGMNSAEFRHGPIEIADKNLSIILLEGDRNTSKYNIKLAEEIDKYGSTVIWVGNHPPESIKSIRIPEVPEIALPLAEILPMQLITLVLTNMKKLEPGKFRYIGKIVLSE